MAAKGRCHDARRASALVEHSFLRRVDARTKLVLALAVSPVIALPLTSVALFVSALGRCGHRRSHAPALRTVHRVRLVLGVLFALDWFWAGCRSRCSSPCAWCC